MKWLFFSVLWGVGMASAVLEGSGVSSGHTAGPRLMNFHEVHVPRVCG